MACNNVVASKDNDKIFYMKIFFVVILVFESDGFISNLLSFDSVLSAWVYAGILIGFTILALIQISRPERNYQLKSFFYPLLMFSVFLMVSAISAFFIFPKPIKDWLPSIYQFTPIFTFYYLYVLKVDARQIVIAFIVVAVVLSMILIVDRVVNFDFLNIYFRRSSFFALDVRRIVILKNELIFGFVALASFYINGSISKSKKQLVLILACFVFMVQAIVMESRMGFMAMGVSILSLLYLKGVSKNVIGIYILGLFVLFIALPIVFEEYIFKLKGMSFYDSESNIAIRFETVAYYYDLYLKSYGFGLGQMSPTGTVNNVLNPYDHYNIVDAGFYSALFQFGPIGLYLCCFFTIKSLRTYHLRYKNHCRSDPYSAACFAFLMGFTISLLPISFFTSSWTVAMGGVLLYLLWSFQKENWDDMQGVLSNNYRSNGGVMN